MTIKNITFIGGGNMAEGIIRGILNAGTLAPEQITVCEINESRSTYMRETYAIEVSSDAGGLAAQADWIVIAVHPQQARKVVCDLQQVIRPQSLIVSICAGIETTQFQEWLGMDYKFARVMPNTMIEARHGYSALYATSNVPEEEKQLLETLMASIGQTMFLEESLFNAFTAFSCAGPEWTLLFMAALIDAGVESGISRENATKIAIENLQGAALMVQATGKNPFQITDTMNTPGGIGIAGFHKLASSGFHGIVMDAVQAALNRTNELGK